MILLDSNIIIYAGKGAYPELHDFIAENSPSVSAISYVEALGYHQITPFEKRYLEAFFSSAKVVAISDSVLKEAVRLRQMRRMTLGDAIIAGTALAHGFRLATRNVADFQWITDLDLLNPLAST